MSGLTISKVKRTGVEIMNAFQTNVNRRIIDLRYEMDDYREARMFHRVAEIRLEIARLQAMLRNHPQGK
jgi:hypothetical protein